MFDSPETTEFHKTVGLTPLYRGKSIICLLYTSDAADDC